MVKRLLENGAHVNAQGGHYDNALRAALEEGHDKEVKILLDNEADVNALDAASYRGDDQLV